MQVISANSLLICAFAQTIHTGLMIIHMSLRNCSVGFIK